MLVAEPVLLAYSVAVGAGRNRVAACTDNVPPHIEFCDSTGGMQGLIRTLFESYAEVQQVDVQRDEDRFSILVALNSFKQAVRRKMYARQLDLYNEFPMYQFDLLLTETSDAEAE